MTELIGEISNNHMGDMMVAEAMIRELADIGVDTVKFQSYRADKLRKDYLDYEREYAYYKKHELSMADHAFLMERCKHYGVNFLTTVFDLDTVADLKRLGLERVKIASPDANSWSLIDRCLDSFKEVIISTGMHNSNELGDLKSYLITSGMADKVTLLHCVSEYPVYPLQVNMKRMQTLMYGPWKFGYSDHTPGINAPSLAIALGADVVECHYTLSRALPGKDHAFAKTRTFMEKLVAWRDAVTVMQGNYAPFMSTAESASREKFRGRWGDNR